MVHASIIIAMRPPRPFSHPRILGIVAAALLVVAGVACDVADDSEVPGDARPLGAGLARPEGEGPLPALPGNLERRRRPAPDPGQGVKPASDGFPVPIEPNGDAPMDEAPSEDGLGPDGIDPEGERPWACGTAHPAPQNAAHVS